VVSIAAAPPSPEQWAHVDAELAARVGFVARLMAGEVPPDLEDVFDAASVALFPRAWAQLDSTCSCPDWENPCKHIAAVLYVFADQLDADPWLLLEWRGRTRDQVLAPLRADVDAGSPVAPWWPFGPGPLPASVLGGDDPSGVIGDSPEVADAVLARLAALPVEVRGTPFAQLLRAAYGALVHERVFV
jgi:hypothetical protein